MASRRVIHVGEGRDKEAVQNVQAYFHKAQITFDKFLIVKLPNEAMDKVRRAT